MAHVLSQSDKQILTTEGFLAGMKTLLNQNRISPDAAGEWLSGFLGSWLGKQVEEADKEIQRLQAVISRLKQTTRSLDTSRNVKLSDPRIVQLTNDLNALDGWTVSLLETDFTMLGLIDAKRAKMKIGELQSAMTALMNQRTTEMNPFFKDPSLFEAYVK